MIMIIADHSMHHSMHGADHSEMDHLTIMSSTTTTEMPDSIHVHHDMTGMHQHHAPAASSGHTMLHHAMSMSVSICVISNNEFVNQLITFLSSILAIMKPYYLSGGKSIV